MAATAVCLLTAGCGGGGADDVAAERPPAADVAASCAFVVDYDGHRYLGNAAPVGPVEGTSLGTATQPGCRDTPGEPEPQDLDVEVAAVEGVSPEIAIVIRGRDDSILIRDDVDFDRLPPELARLLRAPG
jgi:hypothetical protein